MLLKLIEIAWSYSFTMSWKYGMPYVPYVPYMPYATDGQATLQVSQDLFIRHL